jgi:hypothetical protein
MGDVRLWTKNVEGRWVMRGGSARKRARKPKGRSHRFYDGERRMSGRAWPTAGVTDRPLWSLKDPSCVSHVVPLSTVRDSTGKQHDTQNVDRHLSGRHDMARHGKTPNVEARRGMGCMQCPSASSRLVSTPKKNPGLGRSIWPHYWIDG